MNDDDFRKNILYFEIINITNLKRKNNFNVDKNIKSLGQNNKKQ